MKGLTRLALAKAVRDFDYNFFNDKEGIELAFGISTCRPEILINENKAEDSIVAYFWLTDSLGHGISKIGLKLFVYEKYSLIKLENYTFPEGYGDIINNFVSQLYSQFQKQKETEVKLNSAIKNLEKMSIRADVSKMVWEVEYV